MSLDDIAQVTKHYQRKSYKSHSRHNCENFLPGNANVDYNSALYITSPPSSIVIGAHFTRGAAIHPFSA
jgi:hypothetical protein